MTSSKYTATSAFTKLFAVLAYICSLLALSAYFLVFLMPSAIFLDNVVPAQLLPYLALDKAPESGVVLALVVDLLLLTSFAFFHTLLARPRVKAFMKVPTTLERSFYLMQSNFFLLLQIAFWRNFDGMILWDLLHSAVATYTLFALNLFGYLFLVTSTFALDHFALFGLSQGFGTDINKNVGLAVAAEHEDTAKVFVNRWHYRLVAHPIMTGALTMFWATPRMTMPRLMVALVMTVYIFIGVCHFEEVDLKKELGSPYEQYIQSTPRFVPLTMLCAGCGQKETLEENEVTPTGSTRTV